jgi:predicted nucleotide-binding protein
MDRITLFKNKVKNAKQRWLSDKNESEEMYGEGVLTRRQAAKLEDNKNTEDPQPVINNDEDQTDNLSIASNGQEAAENPEAEAPNPKSESENTVKENDNEESYLNNIFKEETLVAENDLLQVFVIQSFFKRQKKFNL